MKVFVEIFGLLMGISLIVWAFAPAENLVGKTTLVWVSDDNPARHEHIQRFNEENADLNLKLDPDNGGMQKVIVQSLGGVGPDLFDSYDSDQLASYVRAGIAWDVTDELAKHGINIAQMCWPFSVQFAVYQGRAYGFPSNVAVDAVWFDKAVFDQARIAYPSGAMTWQQFLPIAEKLTMRDSTGRITRYGFVIDDTIWQTLLPQWGASTFTPDGSRCVLDSPQAIGAAEFLQDLIYKYQVTPTPGAIDAASQQGGWGTTGANFIITGRAAMAYGGRWWLGALRRSPNLALGAFECPHKSQRVFFGSGKATLINRESPHREEALRFLLYTASQEFTELVDRQGDGIGPVVKFCTDQSMINPLFPKENFSSVWRDVMPLGIAPANSPFVNGAIVARIVNNQLDLLRRNSKPAASAMRDAAVEINTAIADSLDNDPKLRSQYRQSTGKDRP